ncbi:Retrovirus-related Pol polyprotein from transposon 17.6 [Vitis vinifera]|uniref:Retrovirus-related Pol polyprotein from transposon 17.6 n=1 Tax=Vitis vinifera TaxID=29760 RepID=A0A438KBT6_VITVI|nr:Retrovirus-related Pol polyprotein from transposon 17.6 [Vitis vinifera]
MRRYNMKLNPSKCAFSISANKFLGFMVTQRGIEVNPDQIKAIIETPTPSNKKELQHLTDKLVALGRFIARFTNKLRPFFLVLRKADAIGWTNNCQSVFDKIKHYLAQPPILSNPQPGKRLHVYLTISDRVPIRSILHKPDLSGRMLQWAIKLSEYEIEYQPSLFRAENRTRWNGGPYGSTEPPGLQGPE